MSFVTSAWYTIFGVRHLFWSGQSCFNLQTQPYLVVSLGFSMLLLCHNINGGYNGIAAADLCNVFIEYLTETISLRNFPSSQSAITCSKLTIETLE